MYMGGATRRVRRAGEHEGRRSVFRVSAQARDLKRTMWWKNFKLWLIIIPLVTLVIYVILGLTCGWTLHCL